MMIRAVLVGHSATEWKLYRQPQWMAEVRRDPAGATLPKRYFDVEEAQFKSALDRWNGSSLESSLRILGEVGAVEITRS